MKKTVGIRKLRVVAFLLLYAVSVDAQPSKPLIGFQLTTGAQFPTTYRQQFGTVSLRGTRGIALEGAVLVTDSLSTRFFWQTGAEVQLLFANSQFGLSVSPMQIPAFAGVTTRVDPHLTNDVTRVGLPLVLGWTPNPEAKTHLYLATGPCLNFYFHGLYSEGVRRSLDDNTGNDQTLYQTERVEPTNDVKVAVGFQLKAGLRFGNRSGGGIGLGAKLSVGNHVTRYRYAVYPGLPDYAAGGSYRINRSYAGLFVSSDFAKPLKRRKPKK